MRSFVIGAALLWGSMLALAGTALLGWWLWGDTGLLFGGLSLPFAAALIVGALVVGEAWEDNGSARQSSEEEVRRFEAEFEDEGLTAIRTEPM